MKKFNVAILGATGMVGQKFLTLLKDHPWFNITVLAASIRSKGKSYQEAVGNRLYMNEEIPLNLKDKIVYDAVSDAKEIAGLVDFVFCAVDMTKEEVKKLEETYAILECPVISNNSANRETPDVPMIIPEVNSSHLEVINSQKRRLNTKKGFIVVKSNCSIQSYVPALAPLFDYEITKILACTYQAISGAGKTLDSCQEIRDNIIPYIAGEEQKSEKEPLKIFGKVNGDSIEAVDNIDITTQCFRVPVSDGHMAAVFVSFKKEITKSDIINRWNNYKSDISQYNLPSLPKKNIYYMDQVDRPQSKLDRDLDRGMGISVGRLREDSQYDVKFVCLSHNTVRGAAGGSILTAELLVAKGYID